MSLRNKDNSVNLTGLGEVAKIIGGFGQLYASLQANKIAKKELKFQQEAYRTNLANQTKSYNMALEDRMRSRYAQMERPGEADAQIARNKL